MQFIRISSLCAVLLLLALAPAHARSPFTCTFSHPGLYKAKNVTEETKKTVEGVKHREITADWIHTSGQTHFTQDMVPFIFGVRLNCDCSEKSIKGLKIVHHPTAPDSWGPFKDKPLRYSAKILCNQKSPTITTIDHKNHYVKGEWTYKIYYDNSLLGTQTFYFD